MMQFVALGGFLSLALLPGASGAATAVDPIRASDAGLVELAPGMHGEGRGTWRGPAESLGRLRATSRVSADGPTFAFDAALARVVPMGPHGPWIEGTLFGDVLAIDPVTGPRVVGTVVGQWYQDVDGRGSLVAHLFVATGNPDDPIACVGRFVGTFRTPSLGSRRSQDGVAAIRWSVT